ncbi:MAG TPA: hypothetical protein VIJ28_01680 [Chloroflexota bacterium]|jgi:cytochrome c5
MNNLLGAKSFAYVALGCMLVLAVQQAADIGNPLAQPVVAAPSVASAAMNPVAACLRAHTLAPIRANGEKIFQYMCWICARATTARAR